MGQDKTRLRALAKALGTAPSTVSSWKIRHSDPPARYIVPIAEFLGVPPLYLLTGKPASPATSSKKKGSSQDRENAPATAWQTASPAEAISPTRSDSTAKTPFEAVQPANTGIEPSADLQMYGELNSLYASLDRAGQVIMLAAGYQQQLRVQSASKDDSPPLRTLVPASKLLTHSDIPQCPCLIVPALAMGIYPKGQRPPNLFMPYKYISN